MNVLMVTSEWPTLDHPEWAPFIVQQVAYLRKSGINVDVFSFRGSKNIVNYSAAWLQVRRKLKTVNYDLIHAQFGQSGLVVLPKVLPLIVTFHGSDVQGDVSPDGKYTFQGKLLKVISKFVASTADEIVVVSSALGRMLDNNLPHHVIPCGLDLNLFQPMDQVTTRKQLGLPQGKKLVLFGGRPEMPVKRYDLARQVVAQLHDHNIEMVVVNSVPHDQMPLYINASDVLLLTSVHEGSPTIVKEALACNLPIVSTDVGDVREHIGTVDGCVVCDDDEPETLAAGILSVLTCNKRVNGRNTVLDLDENTLTQKLISVYKKVLGET